MPPAPHIKDFIPPALWEKLPSAQVFVPQMPQMPAADSQWGAQTWLAMPMSAFMAAISRTGVENAEGGNQPPEPAARRSEMAAIQKKKEEIARLQAIRTAQSVGSVDISAPVAMAAKRKDVRSRRPKEAGRIRSEQTTASTPARRSNAPVELQRQPEPAKGKSAASYPT